MWTVRALAAVCVAAVCVVPGAAACGGGESYGSLPPPGAPSGAGAAPSGVPVSPGASAPSGARPAAEADAGSADAERAAGRRAGERAVEAEVVARYTRFWVEALPAAAAAPASHRAGILAPVTAEPQLTHLVRALAALDAGGRRGYGADVPLTQSVRVRGELALVEGCLDSSHSGVADATSGAPVTRGVLRNPVRADLTRGTDGHWRVSAVTYPPGTTC